jgi:RNA polymerase sigma factor (TIGR02999 family)
MLNVPGDVTRLLKRYQQGDHSVVEALAPLVYADLKRVARKQLAGRPGNTLCATALVNEAFMKMMEKGRLAAHDRAHFLSLMGQCMRWLLIDRARAKRQEKREGNRVRVTLSEDAMGRHEASIDLIALSELLEKLNARDHRLGKVVELRYLAGFSIEETALVMGTSPATVKRDWQFAKAWLSRHLDKGEAA